MDLTSTGRAKDHNTQYFVSSRPKPPALMQLVPWGKRLLDWCSMKIHKSGHNSITNDRPLNVDLDCPCSYSYRVIVVKYEHGRSSVPRVLDLDLH